MNYQFGKYLLLKRLALGGMAEIWLAKQTGVEGFEKLVVVKKILPQYAEEREFVQMFLDEARLAASLNHPNVVQIYDLGQEQGSYFIAMEFIAGHDLLAVLRKCRRMDLGLPPEIAARLVAEACEGLHYAHTRRDNRGQPLNIVHRDVSPSNLLVTYDGGVKVVDFGIAKAESHSSRTAAGKLKGKYAYMSPEHIRSEPVDGRSDVFALGIVLHESLTGHRLYKRDNELAIIQEILEGKVQPPSSLRPEVPPELDQIVLKALEKDRRRRFSSAQEMQLALEKYLSGTADPPTSVHVANFMMRLFSREHAAYQRLLAELPTAAPEELMSLLGQGPTPVSGSSASGISDSPSGSSSSTGGHAEGHPRRRGPLVGMALGAVAALVVLAFFVKPWAVQAPTSGEVLIESEPPGATVIFDGTRTEVKTPGSLKGLELELEHLLRLELEGHEPREVTVTLTPQMASKAISVMLPEAQAPPGRLAVASEPPGATVTLDGKAQPGVTPLELAEVSSGVDHLVRLSLEGYQEEAVTVGVAPRQRVPVKLVLKPKAEAAKPLAQAEPNGTGKKRQVGEVTLTSTPPAEVLHGRKKLGRTPTTVTLPAGRVSLTFVNPELDLARTVAVEVVANEKRRSELVFRKGKLAADVQPWADVYIGDRKLGTTPLAPRELYEGTYTLRLVNSELGAIKALKVEVKPGRTTVVRERLE